jgi:nucleoside-diphosphate-sugar epimerase
MKVLVVGGTGLVGSAVARAVADRGGDVVCLSRSGSAPVGIGAKGDVRAPGLGLGLRDGEQVRDGLTHVVSCFSSVDLTAGPRAAVETHQRGTTNVFEFAAGSATIERVVHVSSVLALGRASKRVGNAELAVGQRFRSWYEYGKFLAEKEARRFDAAPVRIVRLGDTLGSGATFARSARWGLGPAVVAALRGYPIYLADGGRFPIYAGEAATAGEVLVRALTETPSGKVWTWFDDRMPTLAEVLVGLCAAWQVMPRIVTLRAARTLVSALAPRLGIPRALLAYTEPWVDIDPAVLDELPADLPRCPDDYIEAAGRALLDHAATLGVAA